MRTTDAALKAYERSRELLEEFLSGGKFTPYLQGISELELTFLALHRAMRLAEAFMRSPETRVAKARLPMDRQRDELRDFRNAIDHVDGPIKRGEIVPGWMNSVFLTDKLILLDSEKGPLEVRQKDLGDWIRNLHRLCVDVIETVDSVIPGAARRLKTTGFRRQHR